MTTRLIINADDFGLTSGVNQAVSTLYRAGALTSATVMVRGATANDAYARVKELPGLGVGCHVVLIDGTPVVPSHMVPSLLAADGSQFRSSLRSFAQAALTGRLDEIEIEREATAQVEMMLRSGVQPTHLDTHKHTHMFPAVLRPLLRVAEHFGIGAIRNPFEQRWSLHVGRGRFLRRTQIRVLGLLERSFHAQPAIRDRRVLTTRGAIGVSATGYLDATTLTELLAGVPDGTWELVCHPGTFDEELKAVRTRLRKERQIEQEALLSIVPEAASASQIELISFAALANKPV